MNTKIVNVMLYEYCLNFFKVGGKKMLLEHLKGQERWGSIKLSVEEVRKSKICHPRRCHFTMWIDRKSVV